MDLVQRLSGGKVDLTYGRCVFSLAVLKNAEVSFLVSALDIFGGKLVKFEELVKRNKAGGP